jgi:hypothetical protein
VPLSRAISRPTGISSLTLKAAAPISLNPESYKFFIRPKCFCSSAGFVSNRPPSPSSIPAFPSSPRVPPSTPRLHSSATAPIHFRRPPIPQDPSFLRIYKFFIRRKAPLVFSVPLSVLCVTPDFRVSL